MKNKKIKVFVLITAIVVILCSVTATVLATAPSKNKNYKTSLEEVYAHLTGNYKKDNADSELAKIVAYVDGEPVYMAEVIFIKEQAKIDYNKENLSDQKNSEILQMLEKQIKGTDQDIIKDIARQRAMIIEAEKLGISVSDEAIKQKQAELEKEKSDKMAKGDKIEVEIDRQYQELYKKLKVTKEKFYETYDFILQKNYLISKNLIINYMKETGKSLDINAIEGYYDSLLAKVDFRLV